MIASLSFIIEDNTKILINIRLIKKPSNFDYAALNEKIEAIPKNTKFNFEFKVSDTQSITIYL